MKQKTFTKPIKDLIRRQSELRELIGRELNVKAQTVYLYVCQNRGSMEDKPIVTKVIKKYTGLKESEIFDKIKN